MIFDSTPDTSHKDQTSRILRYVVLDWTDVLVKESFVGFVGTEFKDSAGIANMILTNSESDELDVQNCRGQRGGDGRARSLPAQTTH